MNKTINCIGLKCYNPESGEIYENDFNEYCSNFDVYPTIISHKARVIAIGDIHGDMNLAINFLKTAKVIEEIYYPNEKFATSLHTNSFREHINKIKISQNKIENSYDENKSSTIKKTFANTYTETHKKKQVEILYRYYKINGEYYVKIVQEDNNPNHKSRPKNYSCNNLSTYDIFCNNNRWFKWIGSDTYVVQVGDQIDRCRPYDNHVCNLASTTKNDEDSDLEIMLFYDSLDRIAKKKGGRVFSLLGNHEIMNVMGDMRYVSAKGLREYSPEPKNVTDGLNIRKDYFGNIISKKMACTRSTVLAIGDYIFVHGGIASKLAYKYSLVDINSIIRKFLYEPSEYKDDLKKLLNSSSFSPLWYRKLATIPMDINNKQDKLCHSLYEPIINGINKTNANENLNEILNTNAFGVNSNEISTQPILQIKGMVIGHTPQFTIFKKGITTACNNRIIRTDIGASTAFDHFAGMERVENPNFDIDKAREPQVVEILTNLQTKESTIKILHYSDL